MRQFIFAAIITATAIGGVTAEAGAASAADPCTRGYQGQALATCESHLHYCQRFRGEAYAACIQQLH
ncbi:hypothetical protein [Nocardia sp. NPDC020380]|uniref:hypothetical protein n=1 Tax=Nocardia sp. NPDC020380 TaxID=3364309 RepID=UPI0037A75435